MSHTLLLKDAYKQFTLDQDKILSPEETLRQFRARLKKIDIDICRQTIRIDSGRLDIPVYFSLCGADAVNIIGTKKQMGKGGTPAQAEASACMELAERFSFFSFAKNPDNFYIDTYTNVKRQAIPFEMIARSVHDASADLPTSQKIFGKLPLKWTWGYNLTREKEVLIPFDWFFSINEFNGSSAGNCTEEALCQGICEIVERHVSALISHNKLNVPHIRSDSATDPLVVAMIGKYAMAGVRLIISDFSLDMGIPSVGVLAYDPATFPTLSEIVWTAGTAPDPQKALSRALTEVAQLAGDFDSASNYVASGLPKFRTLEQAHYVIAPTSTPIDIARLPNLADPNIKVEVQHLISRLAAKGMEVLVINTMHPELQIPAFFIIVPGAHFRERALETSVAMFSAKHIAENRSPDHAIAELENIDRMLPGKYYVQFYLGSCHLALDAPERALQHFKQAMLLAPSEQDMPSILSHMGVAFKEMERYQDALAVLKEAERLDDERTDVYNLMGFCHFKLKEHEQAIAYFKRVIQLNPSSAIDYANIASNYRDMGLKEKAIRYYEMALTLDASIDFARQNLAVLKAQHGAVNGN